MKRKALLPDETITDQAAVFAVDDEEREHRNEELVEWLTESPQHVAEYLRVRALWETLADPNIALAATPGKHPSVRRYGRALAAAAAVMLVCAGWWFVARPEVHRTTVGEVKSFPLPDRSVVFLNAESRLSVHYSDTVRRVVLHSGEAVFDVASDVERPFVVACGTTTVTALGTKFVVSLRPQQTVVTLIEGHVVVAGELNSDGSPNEPPVRPARLGGRATVALTPGECLIVNDAGHPTVTRVDPTLVATWRHRRLVFESERLADVAAAFNRFNEPLIHVDGEQLRELRISGVFDANDPESLLTFLRSRDGVEVVINADGSATVRLSR
jgi:transmembrane sensor